MKRFTSKRLASLLFLLSMLVLSGIIAAVPVFAANYSTATGSLTTNRVGHTATYLQNGTILITGGYSGASYVSSAEIYNPSTGKSTATGSMTAARAYHTATLLPNGKVLLVGGFNGGAMATAEIYDPSTGVFTATSSIPGLRYYQTATLLPNGTVLVAGGQYSSGVLSSAYIYNPSTGTFSATGSMTAVRGNHTAILLPDGTVLIAGGENSSLSAVSTSEVYNPSTGTFTAKGSMTISRYNHTATLLQNGKVLIAGGMLSNGTYRNTAETYNPATGTFTATGNMAYARSSHTATLLPNGYVLVTGGTSGSWLTSVEAYNPGTGAFINLTGGVLTTARLGHTATLLPDGTVYIAGGQTLSSAEIYNEGMYSAGTAGTFTSGANSIVAMGNHSATLLPTGKVLLAGGLSNTIGNAAQLYDPATGTFATTSAIPVAPDGMYDHTATLLPSGYVLITGGKIGIDITYSTGANGMAFLYDPALGAFSSTGNMKSARDAHTATLLQDGTVLVAGGQIGDNYDGYTGLNSAEIFNPTTGTFMFIGNLTTTRFSHTATLLPDGTVLITGGSDGSSTLASAEIYNPYTGRFTATPGHMVSARCNHTATLLPSGMVLIAGGTNGSSYLTSAEIFNPATGAFTATGSMSSAHYAHTATLLANGKVLVVGGMTYGADVYDPATGTFTATANTVKDRVWHTATLLPDGTVLLMGGSWGSNTTEIFDLGLGFSNSQRPVISDAAFHGSQLALTGTSFQGTSESSGGATNGSATNYPVVWLQNLSTDQAFPLPIDSATNWSSTSFSSSSLSGVPYGYYRATLFANAIPSLQQIVNVAAPSPSISISPTTYNFGGEYMGSSVNKTFSFTNIGDADLHITNMGIGVGFAVGTGTCGNVPITLAPGASCNIQVTFAPIAAQAYSTTMVVTSDDTNSADEKATLTGTGLLQTFPLTVDFAGAGTGTVSGTSTGQPASLAYTTNGSTSIAPAATVVTLTPTASPGSAFGGWSGCTSVSGTNCLVTMNASMTVTAAFATVPNAPTSVTAVAGNGKATISFAPPADGGSSITSFTVTSSAGQTATASSGPIVVTGLTNGTSYTFTVFATNAAGNGPSSAPSNAVISVGIPNAPTTVHAVAGNGQATITFTPPAFNGGSTITSYTVTSSPAGITATGTGSPITITGLTNGTTYSFTVFATNPAGNGPISAPSNFVTPMTVPGAPTAVTAVAANSQATISFTPPASNGGGSITSYTVTSLPGGITATGNGSPVTITGLTNGTTYTFTAVATNAAGNGPASAPSNAVTPIAVPGAPTNVTAVPGNGQATVRFTPPTSSGGSPITSYTVTSSPGGITATGTGSPVTITGLTNGATYTFTVFATNAAGNGPASSASTPISPAGPPSAPSSVTAVAGNAIATVSFIPPASSGGSPVTSYTVTSSPGGITATGSGTTITVTGLNNGTAYTFTVVATNAAGNGPASSPSNSVMPKSFPGAPTDVIAVAGNAQATVRFSPPANTGGSMIMSYTIKSNTGKITVTTSQTSVTIPGLTNGMIYAFTVFATNQVGNGPASIASNGVTPMTLPNAPTAVKAVAGDASAIINFTPPNSNGGGAISSYTVTSNPDFITVSGTGTQITMPGLTNGRTYTFTVVATNAAGNSPSSTPSNAVTPKALPGAPTSVSATVSPSQATVSFTPPTVTGGNPITSYTVVASVGGVTSMGTGSPIIITGLGNGTAYTFKVFATTIAGNGPLSGPSNAVTPMTVPGSPTNAKATINGGTATIQFTAPGANGGSPITAFTVTANPGNITNSGLYSPISLGGLSTGITYTFTLTATNKVGTSAPTTVTVIPPGTVPGAPTGVSGVPADGKVTVSFIAPKIDGGNPISSYIVTSSPGSLTATGPASPVTITGLTNGTSYVFTVKAVNGVGTGPASTSTSSLTPGTSPGAPTNVKATAGNALATVSFSAPVSNGGSPITKYTITANPGGATVSGSYSPMTITGLTNGTAYSFTAIAVNGIGQSPAAATAIPVTPCAAPGVPTSVSAVAGNANATVTFAPPTNDGGSAITAYTVVASGGQSVTGTSNQVTVTGLTNGTKYTFTVKAKNLAGTGIASTASAPITPSTVPGIPAISKVVVGNGQATITFIAPASNGGSPITGYTVTSNPGNILASGTTSPITVTGLANGTVYTFTVGATNANGTTTSAASGRYTPMTMPGAPTGVTAVAGNAQAAVSFTAPASNGGNAITSYTITSNPGNISAKSGTNFATVLGLINGTAYTFTVTATNAAGTGPASDPSAFVIPMTVPGAPTAVTAVAGNSQATVSFTAPTINGGSPVTSYTVTSTGGQAATGTASPITVTGLTHGTAYTFTVVATNPVGNSRASTVSGIVTP